MFEYQQIVDHIRATLGATGPQVPDLCRAALSEYSAAVEAVNGRLRQCESRLKQGLRSEALQICDVEPNLLDSVSALDFPEREIWCQLLSQHGIVLPPQLLVDIAGQLNEAYALEQPMAVLLRQHRLLALARSPLAQRLATLRGLAEVDAGNTVWKSDLQLFERQRLTELQADVTNAIASGSDSALAALDQELSAKNWLTEPPESLLQQIRKSRAKISQLKARTELPPLEEAFHQAQMDSDVVAGRRVREQWQSVAKRAGLSPEDPASQRVSSYLSWLAAEDQEEQAQAAHTAAVNDLELGLLNRVPASNLEYLYSLAEASGREIRPDLKDRYEARLVALERSSRFRNRAILVGAAVTVICLLVAGGFLIMHFRHRAEMEQLASELNGLIETNQLEEAAEYLDELQSASPAKTEDSQIKALAAQVESLKREAQKRESEFKQWIDQAQEKGAGMPNLEALERAKKLAIRESERAVIMKFEQDVIDEQRKAQERRNAEFSKNVAEMETRFHQLELRSRSDLALGRTQLETFQQELQQLDERNRSRVSSEVRELLLPIAQRATDLKVKLEKRQLELVRLAALNESLGDVAAYHKSLADLASLNPTGAKAIALRRVLAERESWEAVSEWNTLASQWTKTALQDLDAAKAANLRDRAEQVLDKCGDFSQAAIVRDRLPFVSAISRRVDNTGARLEARLQRTFSGPLVADIWVVKLLTGQTYYCPSEVVLQKVKPVRIQYYSGFNLAQKTTSVAADKIHKSERAPQAKVALAVKETLFQIDDKNWEKNIFSTLRAIVAESEMDPLLKLDLLRQTLEIACTGSHSLELAFGTHLKALNNAPVNLAANWLDPTDADVQLQRNKAADAIKDFQSNTSLKVPGEKAAAELARFRDGAIGKYLWIGWLNRAESGTWLCEHKSPLAGSGKLFVAMLAGTGKPSRLEPVGMLDKGAIKLEPSSKALLEGRPVYLELAP